VQKWHLRYKTGDISETNWFRAKVATECLYRVSIALLKILEIYWKFTKSPENFYRASYAKRGLGSRNSVRLSVCPSHACFVTNPNNLPAIFLYHTKVQSF